MTASISGDLITISGTGNTCASIVSDVSDTTYAKSIYTGSSLDIYEFNCRFQINANAEWKDEQVWIIHNYDSATDAFTFNASSSLVEWGYLDDTDSTEPFTSDYGTSGYENAPCIYSFRSNNSSQTWCSGEAGTFHMWGGMMRFIDTNTDMRNSSYCVNFPQSTELIQVNVEQFGGVDFYGTGYRVQEVNFKGSENDGFKLSGETTDKLWDIQFHNCDVALDIDSSNDATMRRVRFRGNTGDLACSSYSGELTLLDSDTISSLSGTASFSGGFILEANSYNVKTVQSDGETAESGVRVFCYQKSSGGSTAYGSEKVTDVNGEVSEYILNRLRMDSTHTTIVGKLNYGNAAVRLREYGKIFMDVEKVLGNVGLTDTFVIKTNSFVVANYATASAYTGIAIDETNSEIDLTSSHTMQEVYDWLQYKQAESGELDLEELMITKDGFSYSMPSTWTVTGISYLNLTGKYIIGKFVPITIDGIVNGTRCAVVYNGSTISSGTSSGTSITLCTPYTASANYSVRARLAGYVPFSTLITVSPTGNTVNTNLQQDPEYTS